MEDTQLYAMLLGIKFPWRVSKVQVDMALSCINVWVEEALGTKFPCAVCKQETSVYDHTEEQIWRHLDTVSARHLSTRGYRGQHALWTG